MYLEINAESMDRLRTLVQEVTFAMESELGYSRHGTAAQLTSHSLIKFLNDNNIHVVYASLGHKFMALLITLEDIGHIIMINEALCDYDEAVRKKYLKYLFCHELAHIVMNHKGAELFEVDPIRPDYTAMFRAVRSYFSYLLSVREREVAAEVFAVALGFWPQSDFLRLLRRTRANFRIVANLYGFPVDCAVKWALINYQEQLSMHYFKSNEKTRMIVDQYWPADTMGILGQRDASLFDMPWTAAHQARAISNDYDMLDRAVGSTGYEYACRALFEREKDGFMREGDRIIVAGFRRREFESFITV